MANKPVAVMKTPSFQTHRPIPSNQRTITNLCLAPSETNPGCIRSRSKAPTWPADTPSVLREEIRKRDRGRRRQLPVWELLDESLVAGKQGLERRDQM